MLELFVVACQGCFICLHVYGVYLFACLGCHFFCVSRVFFVVHVWDPYFRVFILCMSMVIIFCMFTGFMFSLIGFHVSH